ncbi:hypothetical protein VE02_04523 [Pseudogymnoascus sp. 03VT05]|nr:hypothetical protein VE02_04523 [Pseudogymnoascus sp. 03VT05]
MCTPMSYDDVAWERSDDVFDAWKHKIYRNDVLQAIGRFVQKHRGGVAIKLCNPLRGSFKVCIKAEFSDGGAAMIRIPCPGVVIFPEEKVKREVATMRYVQENTSIPVPLILHYGMADECPYNLGPFIIMEYVKHAYDLTELFKEQGSTGDTMAIDPNITEEKLSLETREFEYSVSERAMTLNTNELVQLGNFPPSQLRSQTFNSSDSYLQALSDTHITYLSTQHNDAIKSAEDCRGRYIARHLFRKLATEHQLTSGDDKSFKLFCDDLGPHNVLVDAEFKVVAVIDWEFAYSAPSKFSQTPPWWLLIQMPEQISILPVLPHFMRETILLSSPSIDERFFGPRDSFEGRVALLDERDSEGIDAFVQRKLEEQERRILIDWDVDGVASTDNEVASAKAYVLVD